MSGREKTGLPNKSSNLKKDEKKAVEEKKGRDKSRKSMASCRTVKKIGKVNSAANGGEGLQGKVGLPSRRKASLSSVKVVTATRKTRQSDVIQQLDQRQRSMLLNRKPTPIDKLISKNKSAITKTSSKEKESNKSTSEKSVTKLNDGSSKSEAETSSAIVKRSTIDSKRKAIETRKRSMKILASAIARKKGGKKSNFIEIAVKKRLLRSSQPVPKQEKENTKDEKVSKQKVKQRNKVANRKIQAKESGDTTKMANVKKSLNRPVSKKVENVNKGKNEEACSNYQVKTSKDVKVESDCTSNADPLPRTQRHREVKSLNRINPNSVKKLPISPVGLGHWKRGMKLVNRGAGRGMSLGRGRGMLVRKVPYMTRGDSLGLRSGTKRKSNESKAGNDGVERLVKRKRVASDACSKTTDSMADDLSFVTDSEFSFCDSPFTASSAPQIDCLDVKDVKIKKETVGSLHIEDTSIRIKNEPDSPVKPSSKTDTNCNVFMASEELKPSNSAKLSMHSPTDIKGLTELLDVKDYKMKMDRHLSEAEAKLYGNNSESNMRSLTESLMDLDSCSSASSDSKLKSKSDKRLSTDSKSDLLVGDDISDCDILDENVSIKRLKRKREILERKKLRRSLWVRRSLRTVQKNSDTGEITELLKMAESGDDSKKSDQDVESDGLQLLEVEKGSTKSKPSDSLTDPSVDFSLKIEESPLKSQPDSDDFSKTRSSEMLTIYRDKTTPKRSSSLNIGGSPSETRTSEQFSKMPTINKDETTPKRSSLVDTGGGRSNKDRTSIDDIEDRNLFPELHSVHKDKITPSQRSPSVDERIVLEECSTSEQLSDKLTLQKDRTPIISSQMDTKDRRSSEDRASEIFSKVLTIHKDKITPQISPLHDERYVPKECRTLEQLSDTLAIQQESSAPKRSLSVDTRGRRSSGDRTTELFSEVLTIPKDEKSPSLDGSVLSERTTSEQLSDVLTIQKEIAAPKISLSVDARGRRSTDDRTSELLSGVLAIHKEKTTPRSSLSVDTRNRRSSEEDRTSELFSELLSIKDKITPPQRSPLLDERSVLREGNSSDTLIIQKDETVPKKSLSLDIRSNQSGRTSESNHHEKTNIHIKSIAVGSDLEYGDDDSDSLLDSAAKAFGPESKEQELCKENANESKLTIGGVNKPDIIFEDESKNKMEAEESISIVQLKKDVSCESNQNDDDSRKPPIEVVNEVIMPGFKKMCEDESRHEGHKTDSIEEASHKVMHELKDTNDIEEGCTMLDAVSDLINEKEPLPLTSFKEAKNISTIETDVNKNTRVFENVASANVSCDDTIMISTEKLLGEDVKSEEKDMKVLKIDVANPERSQLLKDVNVRKSEEEVLTKDIIVNSKEEKETIVDGGTDEVRLDRKEIIAEGIFGKGKEVTQSDMDNILGDDFRQNNFADDENPFPESNEISNLLNKLLEENMDEEKIAENRENKIVESDGKTTTNDENFSDQSSSSSSYTSAVTELPTSVDSDALENVYSLSNNEWNEMKHDDASAGNSSSNHMLTPLILKINKDKQITEDVKEKEDGKSELPKVLEISTESSAMLESHETRIIREENSKPIQLDEDHAALVIDSGDNKDSSLPSIKETPEERANKESILSALGLQSLHNFGDDKTKKPDNSYTGTLKAVIKLNDKKSGDRKMFFKQGELTENGVGVGGSGSSMSIGTVDGSGDQMEYKYYTEVDQNNESFESSQGFGGEGDGSNLNRKPLPKHMRTSSLDENTSAFVPTPVDNQVSDASGDDKGGRSLVIPEKSSSFSIHPGRLCSDICSYCFGKFGSLDTPCHLAQLKNAERQRKILANENHLKMDSCLCDGCYRYVDRKANCPQTQRVRKQRRTLPNTSCSVQGCEQPARHSIRRKWLIKLKKSIAKKLDIDMDKNPHLPFPLCSQHYYWVDYFTVCGICKKRLNRNHMYALGSEAEDLNLALRDDGIPVRLSDKLFLCKLCRYYSSLRLKYRDLTTLTASHKLFLRSYRKKILTYLDITVSESDEDSTKCLQEEERKDIQLMQDQPKSKKRKSKSGSQESKKRKTESGEDLDNEDEPQMIDYSFLDTLERKGNGNSEFGNDRYEEQECPVGFSNIASFLGGPALDNRQGKYVQDTQRPRVDVVKPTRIQVKFGNLNIRKLSNLNIGQDSRHREKSTTPEEDPPNRPPYLPGERELPLTGELRKEASHGGNGWEKCTLSVQFDQETKRLWNELQRPYGNQSSFLRHLIMLEKYYRSGSLVLSENADPRAVKYNSSVQNRVQAYEGKPRVATPMPRTTSTQPSMSPSMTVRLSTPSSTITTQSMTVTTTLSSPMLSTSSALMNLPSVSIVSPSVSVPLTSSASSSPVPSISLTLQPGPPAPRTPIPTVPIPQPVSTPNVIPLIDIEPKIHTKPTPVPTQMAGPPPPPLLKLDSNMWQKIQPSQGSPIYNLKVQSNPLVRPYKVFVSSSGHQSTHQTSNPITLPIKTFPNVMVRSTTPKPKGFVQDKNPRSITVTYQQFQAIQRRNSSMKEQPSSTPLTSIYASAPHIGSSNATSISITNAVTNVTNVMSQNPITTIKTSANPDAFIPMICDVRSLAGPSRSSWAATATSQHQRPSHMMGKNPKVTYYTPILPKMPSALTVTQIVPTTSPGGGLQSVTLMNSALTIEKAPSVDSAPSISVPEKPSISVFREDCTSGGV